MIQEKIAPFGAYAQKEMTLDLLLTQDQGSSIVDGINHLRNLLLSIDLFLWEFDCIKNGKTFFVEYNGESGICIYSECRFIP